MNILQFLRGLQRNKLSKEGNYLNALYLYRTSDNRQFTISENGWHIINKSNAIADNSTLTSLTADRLVKLHKFSTSYDQYNYLIHPSTIEGTSGDHVLITVAKPDTLVTKDNLEKTKSELMDEWSHKGKIENAYTISAGEYEVIEAEIIESSELINKELKDANLPDQIRIGAVLRDKKVIIPKSDFIFQNDDQVVLIVKKDTISVVENLFRLSSV